MYSKLVDIDSDKESEIQDYCVSNEAYLEASRLFTQCKEILDKVSTYERDSDYMEAINRIVHAIDGIPCQLTFVDYGTLLAYYHVRRVTSNGMRRATKHIEHRYSVPE